MDNLTTQQKRQLLFTRCASKDHLHKWIKVFFDLDIPNSIVCDDDVANPPSNSSPMDLIWEIYQKAIDGKDKNFMRVLGYSARDGFKCQVKGTKLLSKTDGLVNIENVKIGDTIWSGKAWQRVTDWIHDGVKESVTIKLDNGLCSTGSPIHRVWAWEPGKTPNWKKMSELTDDDLVCVDTSSDFYDTAINKEHYDIGYRYSNGTSLEEVPEICYRNNSYLAGFVSGLLDSNGYIDDKNGNIELSFKEEKLGEQVLVILHALGINSTLVDRTILINEIPALIRAGIAFKAIIPFNGDCTSATQSERFLKNKWVKVKTKKSGSADFYDLTVENDHSYWSNGIISHNTLSAAVIEALCLLHLGRNVAHLAAIETQARKCQDYVDRFFKRPVLRDFPTSKNKRSIEICRYLGKDGSILTESEFLALDNASKDNYIEKKNSIVIVICNEVGANSAHVPFVVFDELDLADPKGYKEAKFIASPGEENRELPITFLTSTRKTSTGLVQNEIDAASNSGLVIRHWNIIDVTEACPPSRHLPEEPRIKIFYSENQLRAIPPEDYNLLSEKEKQDFVEGEGYSGCIKNCRIFAQCKGRLATKQLSKSKMLKPIDKVEDDFRNNSLDYAKAQLLCFAENTQIFMADGSCKSIQDIKVGDNVISHTGHTRKVIEVMNRELNGEIFNVSHPNWRDHSGAYSGTLVTAEHPYFVNGKDFIPISAAKVSSGKDRRLLGDYLSMPISYSVKDIKKINIYDYIGGYLEDDKLKITIGGGGRGIPETIELNKEFGWILGFFLAEGHFFRRSYKNDGSDEKITGISFASHIKETEFHDKIRQFANSLGLTTSDFKAKKGNGYSQDIYNVPLATLFNKLCGEHCDGKRIDESLMNADLGFLESILEGFYCGDGTKRFEPSRELTTTSYKLATQLFLIAARLGLNPRIRKQILTVGKKQVYRVYYQNKKFIYKQNRNKFKIANNYNLYRLDNIKKQQFTGKVYNLEVEEDHSYIANGVAVHNCWKPSSEGLIYPNFNSMLHVITAAEMANKITGEEYPAHFSKSQLIDLMNMGGAQWFSGLDFGFVHHFAVVTAALIGHILYVVDVISEKNLELQEKVEICKSRIMPLKPKIYPDNAYPSDIKTFRRHGFTMVDFRKDVTEGIEAVRMRLMPGSGRAPTMFFLKDDPNVDLLIRRIRGYHFKTDTAGNLTDDPVKENDDELDALRYLCQNVPVGKSNFSFSFGFAEKAPIYSKNPNEDWMKNKIKELSGDTEGQVQISGKKGFLFSF